MLVPVAAGCQFSFSSGGPDYKKLETAIADELNKQYSPMSREVSTVECPRPSDPPKTGSTFDCVADLEGNDVRVKVTFTDDDYNVNYATLDVVFDLVDTGKGLSKEVSEDYGFPVKVTCGSGLKVVAVGESFECEASDRRGDTRPVKVTAGGPDGEDTWEVVGGS
ncbi:hypothetical protein NGTWS0302_35520 [Mycolicibacterium cyprinidarum]|uniref:DUF4333 domain-containing protein n=1 Tax=Mycolicibacterium cyprinidarum TaxID=2860311 RepID=A0ABQ4V5I5_9MYCO|nr:hypothetical protein NGTWS1702_34390 [Mycolicibacterium sp. NGTWSNA01]GJF14121.1 hypothetical protein NGTWS0302_35520 [Mycolicibacterium sp. NGTWS0302]GJF15772.1 hypothetical protein NGTWS1803_30830 [Mycolicibacterium sp. NGTWS1803]